MKHSLTALVCSFCLVGVALAEEGVIDKAGAAIERGADATVLALSVAWRPQVMAFSVVLKPLFMELKSGYRQQIGESGAGPKRLVTHYRKWLKRSFHRLMADWLTD